MAPSFFFLIVFFTNIYIKPSQCALPVHQPAVNYPDLSSLAEKLSLIKGKDQDAVSRFRCPEEWRRFGGSCYYLSNVTSTASEANQTCNRAYLNQSQLMQIRHPVEFFYAAHVLVTNDLSAFLIEIDPHLFKDKKFAEEFSLNDQVKWQSTEDKFRQTRLNYYNRKKKISGQLQRKKKLNHENENEYIKCAQTDSQSTANEKDLSKKDEIDSSNDEDNSERLDDIRKVCDRLAWNAINDNSSVFILTRYFMSGKPICSINDIDPGISYTHMCQYVLDYCFGNDICGKHGRCVNHLVGFTCSCYFWSDGPLCSKVSQKFIQLVIGLAIIVVLLICTLKSLPRYQRRAVKRMHDFYKTRFPTCDHAQDNRSAAYINSGSTSTTASEKQKRNVPRFLLVSGLTITILCLLCIIPSAYHWNSLQLHNTEQLKFDLLVNDTIRTMTQCGRTSIFKIDNNIFIIISAALCAIFFLLIISQKGCPSNCSGQSGGCPSPIDPFSISNRYETAALSGIVMIEILIALEHFLVDLSELWNQGVLEQFRDRVLTPFLFSIRFYPIFISLQRRDRYVRLLAFIYIAGNITYMIIRRSACMDFLPVSNRFSTFIEATRRVELGSWTIIYGLIKTAPQLILLSYIGAELTVRFIYDSIYVRRSKKKTNRVSSLPPTPGVGFDQQFSPASSPGNSPSSVNSSPTHRSCIQKIIDKIYRRHKDFKFTTIAMCAYTVTIVLILYLTCIFAFQPIMETDSMPILIFCLEQTLNIEIDEWSFHGEIIFSAVLTMILFGIQLLYGIKNYKKHTGQLKENKYTDIPAESELEKDSKAPESVGYLAFIFLSIVGGFYIWFHLILFIVMIFSLILFHSFQFQIVPYEPILSLLSFILPLVVLYGLKSCITRWLCIFTATDQSRNAQNNVNEKVYAVLIYLTFMFSCHIAIFYCIVRLTMGILFNILLMPRLDCSYLGRKYEKWDSGFISYVSYLHMEKPYRQPIQDAHRLVQPEPIRVQSEPILIQHESKLIQTENMIDELPDNQSVTSEHANYRNMSGSVGTLAGESEEEGPDRSALVREAHDFIDTISTTSTSTLRKIQRSQIIEAPSDSILPTSVNVQARIRDIEQILPKAPTQRNAGKPGSTLEMKAYKDNSKEETNIIVVNPEQKHLLASTSDESSEENDPLKRREKNNRRSTKK